MYFYKYANWSLMNINDGTLKWKCPVDSLEQKQQNIIALQPYILLCASSDTSTTFTAIDPEKGNKRWKHTIKGSKISYRMGENDVIYVVYESKPTWNIECINQKDGMVAWSLPVEGIDANTYVSYFLPGSTLTAVIGNNMVAVDQNIKNIRWRKNIPNGILSCFERDDKIWYYTKNKIVGLQLADGNISSETGAKTGRFEQLSLNDNDAVIFEYDTLKQNYLLYDLNLTDKKVVWEKKLENRLYSIFYYKNNDLLFTTKDRFYCLDLKTGEEKYTITLNPLIRTGSYAIDQLFITDNYLIVSAEKSIIRISVSEKKITDEIFTGDNGGFTPSFINNKMFEWLNMAGFYASLPKNVNKTQLSNDVFYNMARQNQDWVNYKTKSTVAVNSNASHADKISAYNQRGLAAQNTYLMGQTQAYQNLANAYANVGAAVANAIMQLVIAKIMNQITSAINHNMDYMKKNINTFLGFQNSLYTGYYQIRPYYNDGWNMGVYDMRDFSFTCLPMTPEMVAYRYSAIKTYPMAFVEKGDKKFLITKTAKITSNTPGTYVLRIMENANTRAVDYLIPKPSVVCYDISVLQTGKTPLIKPRNSNLTDDQKKLAEACNTYNYKEMKRLIKAGVDVNFTDEYGYTMLINVCKKTDLKMLKIMLKAGADPTIKDPEGMDAAYHILTPANKQAYIDIKELVKMYKLLDKYSKKKKK